MKTTNRMSNSATGDRPDRQDDVTGRAHRCGLVVAPWAWEGQTVFLFTVGPYDMFIDPARSTPIDDTLWLVDKATGRAECVGAPPGTPEFALRSAGHLVGDVAAFNEWNAL
jgi:hypothetical protein